MPRPEDKQDERLPGSKPDDGLPDTQGATTQDWEELEGADLLPAGAPESGDFRPDEHNEPGELPGEDEDNPYQESDEALPDDAEERTISRNPSREGGRFDDT